MAKQLSYKPLLRTIGQALESLKVDEFDLIITGDEFIVTSQSPIPQTSWQRFRHYFIKPTTDQPRQPVGEFRYTLADLSVLELDFQKSAVDGNRVPDRQSLPQILRIVGTYVDQKQGELLSVSKRNASFLITYLNTDGEKLTEDLLYLDVDSLFVREFKLRQEHGEMSKGRGQASPLADPSVIPGNLAGAKFVGDPYPRS